MTDEDLLSLIQNHLEAKNLIIHNLKFENRQLKEELEQYKADTGELDPKHTQRTVNVVSYLAEEFVREYVAVHEPYPEEAGESTESLVQQKYGSKYSKVILDLLISKLETSHNSEYWMPLP